MPCRGKNKRAPGPLKSLQRKNYKSGSVEEAQREADMLLELLPASRREKIIFKYSPGNTNVEEAPQKRSTKRIQIENWEEIKAKALSSKSAKKCGILETPSAPSYQRHERKPSLYSTKHAIQELGLSAGNGTSHAGRGPVTSHAGRGPVNHITCSSVGVPLQQSDQKPRLYEKYASHNEKLQPACLPLKHHYMSTEDLLGSEENKNPKPKPSGRQKKPDGHHVRFNFDDDQTKSDTHDLKSTGMCSPMSDVSRKRRVLTEQIRGSKLIGRTKEEKYQLDVEMYQRNEQAFEHDVSRFMLRNDCKIRRNPCWQNTPITLFQLFLAVYERGGFNQVGWKQGGWDGVYRELTGKRANGMVAKNYYKKNLLPYELYISGKDYISSLKRKTRKVRCDKSQPRKDQGKQIIQKEAESGEKEQQVTGSEEESLSEGDLDEIDRLLEELEDIDEDGVLKPASVTERKPAIEVTYFGDSPRLGAAHPQQHYLPDTAGEFRHVPRPDSGAQEVPMSVRAESVTSDSDGERVLHEMEALQQELDMLHQHL